jgi:hypothetical protein
MSLFSGGTSLTRCAAIACALCLSAPFRNCSAETNATVSKSIWSVKPLFSLQHYGIYQSHPFFSTESRQWMETSVRFGGKVNYGHLSAEVSGLGLKTTGRDPYGSGSVPAGAPPGAKRAGLDPQFDIDTFYLQWENGEHYPHYPLKASVGRQPLALGTQFLIGEGVYDGYHRNYPQAVFHTPRNWFDAARVQFDWSKTHFDTILYRVHPTEEAAGQQDGFVSGLDVSRVFESIGGAYGGGVFYRESASNLDNDMAVLNLRGKQAWPLKTNLYAGAEYVYEFGRGRNPYYVTRPGQDLDEFAWHVELGYQADERRFKPFAEVGYVYYSTDFTPLATGFSDWDSWYLGNQIDWIIFGTNTRIIRTKAGFWPHEKIKVLGFYHHTELVSGPSGTLSDEWTLITEWYPNDKWWVSLLIGYAKPGSALAKAGLQNAFQQINAGAVSVGSRDSLDLMLGFGVSF